jgi:hypothetical protein
LPNVAEAAWTRRSGLTVFQLPPYAPELNPVEPVWSNLKRSLANLTKHADFADQAQPGQPPRQYGPELARTSSSLIFGGRAGHPSESSAAR